MAHSTDSPHLHLDISERANRSGGGWYLDSPPTEAWAWVDTFTPEECDSIIRIATRQGLVFGETAGRAGQDRRNSNLTFLHPSGHTDWMFRRLSDTITTANQFFGFDLVSMNEGIQFTEYVAPDGNYGWHADSGPGTSIRKLSLTIQLTDPSDYDGGELELNPDGTPVTMDKVRGRAFAFPSWTLHQVRPVTRGVRHSLVVWVAGPPFR